MAPQTASLPLTANGAKSVSATGRTGGLPVLAAAFKITEKSLEALKNAHVSDDLLDQLNALKDQCFLGKKTFLDELVKIIGRDQLDPLKGLILKYAGEPQLTLNYYVGGGVAGLLGTNLE